MPQNDGIAIRSTSPVYTRNELPENHRMQIARSRARYRQQQRLPQWLQDQPVVTRILSVYRMYIERHTLAEIAAAHINPQTGRAISLTQIYKDINRAREIRLHLFEAEIDNILMEQIEARHILINEARLSLTRLRAGIPQPEGVELILEWTPAHARAEADLLRVISENERAIEELTGLRDRVPSKTDDSQKEPSVPGPNVIIDMRQDSHDVTDERKQTVIVRR